MRARRQTSVVEVLVTSSRRIKLMMSECRRPLESRVFAGHAVRKPRAVASAHDVIEQRYR